MAGENKIVKRIQPLNEEKFFLLTSPLVSVFFWLEFVTLVNNVQLTPENNALHGKESCGGEQTETRQDDQRGIYLCQQNKIDGTGGRFQHCGDHTERRRFTCAVCTEQGKNPAWFALKADTGQGINLIPEPFFLQKLPLLLTDLELFA